MDFLLKVWNNYDEVVSAGTGMFLGKLYNKTVSKMFPRWTGQLAKFIKAGGELFLGMAIFQWGKENKTTNVQYIGLGMGVEAVSNIVEAISNNSLDGIAEGTVSFVTGARETNPTPHPVLKADSPVPMLTSRELGTAPIIDDEDEEEYDEPEAEEVNGEVVNQEVQRQYDYVDVEPIETEFEVY